MPTVQCANSSTLHRHPRIEARRQNALLPARPSRAVQAGVIKDRLNAQACILDLFLQGFGFGGNVHGHALCAYAWRAQALFYAGSHWTVTRLSNMRFRISTESARIVRGILQSKGMTQEKLAEQVGVNQSTIHRWTGGAEIRSAEHRRKLLTIARERGVPSDDLVEPSAGIDLAEHEVALNGYIGAGAAVFRIEHDTVTNDIEYVRVPVGWGEIAAYKVKGDSMYPAYRDGDILACPEYSGSIDSLIGKDCLIRTADERLLIKTLERGSQAGRYDLTSHNAPPLRNQHVLEAKPVRYVQKG